ncbi:MAG: proton-conducting membrane transporter [Halobacteriaceae archaeon]
MSDAENRVWIPGLAAVALFVVMAAIFVQVDVGSGAGFPTDGSITAGIGYLLFDLTGSTELGSEGFLAAFEIVDVVLVAALVGGVMLARRDRDTDDDPTVADGGTEDGGGR